VDVILIHSNVYDFNVKLFASFTDDLFRRFRNLKEIKLENS